MNNFLETDAALNGAEPLVDRRDAEMSSRVLFVAADRDPDAGTMDDATGCEFVDDRIRVE